MLVKVGGEDTADKAGISIRVGRDDDVRFPNWNVIWDKLGTTELGEDEKESEREAARWMCGEYQQKYSHTCILESRGGWMLYVDEKLLFLSSIL